MKPSYKTEHPVPFLTFWCLITKNLGDAHGSIDPNIKTSQQLFSTFDDQLGLLKDVVIDSYSKNKCHHIKSNIDVNIVLDTLGAKAFELTLKQADDLLDIELLEEICWLICQHYGHLILMPEFNDVENEHKASTTLSKATIFSLQKTKTRLANNKL